jgi:putative ribosome biogenesis GTPase RsgA
MKTNDDYICLVLGETGVGKSSFINAITNSNNCEVGDEG